MRFSCVGALLALAVGAVAQSPVPYTSVPADVQNSVLMVLATALPKESVSYALASSSEFAAQMASSLAAGNPPAWYQALPSDVKSLLPALYPIVHSATPTPTPSASSSLAMSTPASSVPSVSAYPTGGNSTSASGVHMPTLSSTASASGPAQATANAASYPGAALGAGVGAALGFIGMLAL
ncbi:hypothetical protein HBI56_132490 [Parastagonospora nodorum]|nr:hypothetical protein HBI09_035900 [Parastagonospora nodorum]KAH4948981.1 hypothetical protein HBH74_033000 [Parastagonospora nodorum]KAH4982703.1 hypothetical protein HBH73_029300 [Parastagonospora nodorum]KAH4999580.1 hypothetical protein HBI77_174250 [Parastagonospora nodorum]KAH5072738.1 hypothetical protein HBH95_161510 [Parastagonospora nodorum]